MYRAELVLDTQTNDKEIAGKGPTISHTIKETAGCEGANICNALYKHRVIKRQLLSDSPRVPRAQEQ